MRSQSYDIIYGKFGFDCVKLTSPDLCEDTTCTKLQETTFNYFISSQKIKTHLTEKNTEQQIICLKYIVWPRFPLSTPSIIIIFPQLQISVLEVG